MALQMPFETSDGVEHSESYWRVVQANVDFYGGSARVTLLGWHNKQARDNGKSPLEGAEKSYDILRADEYDAWFAPAALDDAGRNHAAQAYAFARAKQDVQSQDGAGKLILCSFFADAEDV